MTFFLIYSVRFRAVLAFGISLLAAGPSVADTPGQQKAARTVLPVGWIENVIITPGDLEIRAKLDTGARTSSLHAPHYRTFRKGGVDWVRFSVTNREGTTKAFERRIVRVARIKRIKGKSQERPVVMLGICIGNVFRETQVNLVDRDGFNYQMLIGRRFMARHVSVNPARTLTTKPQCREKAE